ncbi:amidohydrolase [Bacillus sp. 1P06AnD]|uniref:amidohydrolase n=1 Tax=Bacillus sp. 1P06AnD TaxID=3132208 RepID=UPI0039A038EA
MKNITELKQLFEDALLRNHDIAHALNYDLAEHPEVSGEEFESCKKYVNICRDKGMDVEENFCGLPTSFRAKAVCKEQPRARMAVLAEYDALPNLGHGCGHSASGSLSLLTVLALQDMADELDMDIDLIGTPDEELHGEKALMANKGIFKEYDFAMMIHMNSNATFPSLRFLALSGFRVKFHGATAHASASPWEGKNALNAAQLTLQAVDMLRQHVLPDTRMSYFIVNGGEASNIIPDFAEIELLLRHSKREYLDTVIDKVKNCIKGACTATGTTYEMETLGYHYSDMLLNEPGINVIRSAMKELNVPFMEDDGSMMGSSDIGNVSYECPAFHPMLATSDQYFALHTQEMVDVMKSEKAKEIIDRGARIIGYTMLNLMADPELMKQVKNDFLNHTKVN